MSWCLVSREGHGHSSWFGVIPLDFRVLSCWNRSDVGPPNIQSAHDREAAGSGMMACSMAPLSKAAPLTSEICEIIHRRAMVDRPASALPPPMSE